MKYEVCGTTMQTVAIDLAAGEEVYSQTSAMAWMTDGVRMDTNTNGGLWEGIKRSLSGGSFFITTFSAERNAHIAFASKFPGTIMPVTLKDGESLLCRKETFLCAEKSVGLEMAWQKNMGTGLFGGEGFILQRVSGPGTVWLDLSGEVVTKDLASGERLLVHAGHVGIQSPTVTMDIQMVGGIKNALFGGEGLFLATLTGPGRIWLQSMPIVNLAGAIARYMPGGRSESTTTNITTSGTVGGLLGLAAMLGNNERNT